MRFRLSVTQLRILLIAGNLFLAGGVFAYAGYSFYSLKDQEQKQPPIDLAKIAASLSNVTPSQAQSASLTVASAISLLPPKPRLPTVSEGTEATAPPEPETVRGPDELPTGPLGEGEQPWEYVSYIYYGSPEDTFVVLKKKTETAANAPRPTTRTSAYTRGRVVTSSSRVTPRPPIRGGAQQSSDRISFFVNQRVFQNTEIGLDFMIHSADQEKFVYWIPGKPEQRYALPYITPPGILAKPDAGLRPPEEPEGAEGDVEPKQHFIELPENFEKMREEEYQRMLKGGAPGPAMTSLRDAEGSTAPGAAAATPGAGGPATTVTLPGSGSRTPGGAGVSRRPPTEEERRKLREVLQSPNMTPEDRAKLGEAMRGRPQPGGGPPARGNEPPAEAGQPPEAPQAQPAPQEEASPEGEE